MGRGGQRGPRGPRGTGDEGGGGDGGDEGVVDEGVVEVAIPTRRLAAVVAEVLRDPGGLGPSIAAAVAGVLSPGRGAAGQRKAPPPRGEGGGRGAARSLQLEGPSQRRARGPGEETSEAKRRRTGAATEGPSAAGGGDSVASLDPGGDTAPTPIGAPTPAPIAPGGAAAPIAAPGGAAAPVLRFAGPGDESCWVEVPQPKDGNCLFHAVADQLGGDHTHEGVRKTVALRLREHPDAYMPGVLGEDLEDLRRARTDRARIYAAYVDDMARPGEHGDRYALQAAADVYGRRIEVLTIYLNKGGEVIEDIHAFDPGSNRLGATSAAQPEPSLRMIFRGIAEHFNSARLWDPPRGAEAPAEATETPAEAPTETPATKSKRPKNKSRADDAGTKEPKKKKKADKRASKAKSKQGAPEEAPAAGEPAAEEPRGGGGGGGGGGAGTPRTPRATRTPTTRAAARAARRPRRSTGGWTSCWRRRHLVPTSRRGFRRRRPRRRWGPQVAWPTPPPQLRGRRPGTARRATSRPRRRCPMTPAR